MPDISKKGQHMPASPIRKLVPYSNAAKARGTKVFHLNIGQPDIQTPDVAWKALKENELKVLEYSPSEGFYSYRSKLAEYYGRQGIMLSPEHIMVTTGGSEALTFGLFSCLDSGDEIIIPEPFYANYNGFAIAGDIAVRPITASIENGFALPDISDFEELITPRTQAIMICNPNNPTGYLYSEEELEALRDIVLRHDLFLFADEVYREFVYDGQKHFSILNLQGLEDHAIVVDSISKRYSACGARIGALVTRNEDVMETAMKFAQARLSPPTLAQIIGEACVDVDQSYFDKVHSEYDERRKTVVDGLSSIPGVVCPNPGGAFYTMAQLPVDDSEVFCQWLLESFEVDGETVMLAPGSGFYASPELGKQEVRIAYVLNKVDLQHALDILKIALEVYPGKLASNSNNNLQTVTQ